MSFAYQQSYTDLKAADLAAMPQHLEDCRFERCELDGLDLSEKKFEECTFHDCYFKANNLTKTAFQNVTFEKCKLTGLDFEPCSSMLLDMTFVDSTLSICSFRGVGLKDMKCRVSEFDECDFSEADLQGVIFDRCSLKRSTFDQSDLKKADFREATDFDINPEWNKMKGARFSSSNLIGLLRKYGLKVD